MMKFLSLLLLALLLMHISFAQKSKSNSNNCCSLKRQLNSINSNSVSIYFNEQGVPDKPIEFVRFGTQVNIIAKNVNPNRTLPVSTLTFASFSSSQSTSVPDLAAMLNGTTPTKANESDVQAANDISNKGLTKSFSNAIGIISDLEKLTERNQATTKNYDEKFEGFSQLQQSFDNAEKSSGTNKDVEMKSLLKNLKDSYKQLEVKMKELNNNNVLLKKKYDSALNLLSKLDEQLKLIENRKNWGSELKNAYDSFSKELNQLSHFLNFNHSVNSLFNTQFIDSAFTKRMIVKILQSHLPGLDNNLENSLDVSNKFLVGKFENLMRLYGVIANYYRLINELPVVDSFFSEKPIDFKVVSKDKKEATVNLNKVKVSINREPLFKEQMEFVSSKFTFIKNEKFRDSIFIFSDTLITRVLKLYNSSFTQEIKTFQANADEITIKLPYANAEPYKIKTFCRFKVEGSTGLFVHALNTGDKYKTIKITDDSLQVIRQSKEGLVYSFGFLAHFYNYDPRKKFNLGGSFGINFPINNQTNSGLLQIVGGLTFHSTTIEKLSFSIGASFRKGQKLNTSNLNSIDGNKIYSFKNKSDLEPVYDPLSQMGLFFGLSYSLFGTGSSKESK